MSVFVVLCLHFFVCIVFCLFLLLQFLFVVDSEHGFAVGTQYVERWMGKEACRLTLVTLSYWINYWLKGSIFFILVRMQIGLLGGHILSVERGFVMGMPSLDANITITTYHLKWKNRRQSILLKTH